MQHACVYLYSPLPPEDASHRWLMVLFVCPGSQIMCLVGESFDDASDEVCGAVVQIRNKGDKVAIWTGNQNQGDEIRHIG